MRKLVQTFLTLTLFLISSLASAKYVQDVDRHVIDFKDLNGKWVLINFWATWCEPCVNEIAEFNKLYTKRSKDIAMFAVNFDALSVDEQKDIAEKYAIKYPTILQDSINNLQLGEIPVIPMTFIFNPQGELATKLYGGQTLASLEKTLNDLAQQ